jgi:uncharacterized protein YjbI with pentapeptide repeats
MANEEHLDLLKQGTTKWNTWRSVSNCLVPDLNRADLYNIDLSGANLSHASFISANFNQAILHKADCQGADFSHTFLSGANLSGAILRDTLLSGANLEDADLTGADMTEANLYQANLSGAKFGEIELRGAFLSGADLRAADLRGAQFSEMNLSDAFLFLSNLEGADLKKANLKGANLTLANLTLADLSGANLQSSILIDTNVEQTTLTGCSIHGISAWALKGIPKDQSNLIITRDKDPVTLIGDESTITVDNLEVAQFIYLLLYNEKLHDIIGTIGKKGVLIIGRFTKKRKAILHAIADELRNRYDLLPIMFEFHPLSTEPTIKTLSTLAHLSRFVIADLTDPKSVLQELTTILLELPTLPVQLILHEAAGMPPMGDGFLMGKSVLPPYVYSTKHQLIADLPDKVVAPALGLATKFESELADLRQKWLPWQSS